MRVILGQWQMATIFKNEINNSFIENVTWAAPWCGRTEPLESSPLSPAITHNIHVIQAARISALAKWNVLGVTCTAHDWPIASSSRYFGALDKTHPSPTHPHGLIGNVPVHICRDSDTQHSQQNTWRCAQSYRYRSLCLSVCLSHYFQLCNLPYFTRQLQFVIGLLQALYTPSFEQAAELLEHLNSKIKRTNALTLKLYLLTHNLS